MIVTNRTVTVNNGKSKINEPIVAYRGDYELEVRFIILNSTFNFIETKNAAFGQLAVLTPYGGNIFSSVAECNEGAISFLLSKDMLDQIEEVGLYSFQIRLFDQDKQSRISIPPVEHGIEIREPIASEDHDNTVNNAIVGYSIARVVNPKEGIIGDTFDEYGNYKKTKWETGDRISEVKLNKIEDAIDKVNKNEINNTSTLSKRITNNFNVISSELNLKRDKNVKISSYDLDISTNDNKIKLNNLSEEVITAMSGDTSVAAIIPNNSITNEKYADGSISLEKLKGYIPSKNLFDKSDVLVGVYVDYASGEIKTNAEYVTSDFIPVKPNTSYARNVIDQIAVYNSNHEYVTGYGYTDNVIATPNDAHYVRVCLKQKYMDIFQLEEGYTTTDYEKYSPKINKLNVEYSNIQIDDHMIDNKKISFETGYIVGGHNMFYVDPRLKIFKGAYYDVNMFVTTTNEHHRLDPTLIHTDGITDWTNALYVFYNRNNGYVEVYNTAYGIPKNVGLIFLTSIYSGVVSHNKHAFFIVNDVDTDKINLSNISDSITSKNLFDHTNVLEGYYAAYNNGLMNVNDTYAVSGKIFVEPGCTYYRNIKDQIACYNRFDIIIGGFNSNHGNLITMPTDCSYIRVNLPIDRLYDFQLLKGDSIPTADITEKYSVQLPSLELVRNNFSSNGIIPISAIEGSKRSKNLFDKNTVFIGKYVRWNNGTIGDNPEYFTSDYIEVEPNTTYCRTEVDQLAFYTESKEYISGCGYDQPLYFTTPDNCKYILICAKLKYLDSFQVEAGDKPSAYEEYGFTLDVSSYPEALYTLNDAWAHWKNNEKFPIGFLGDSTTDGVGTTGWDKETNGHATQDTNNGGWGSVDYINQNTYSYKLEQLIKEETKNNNARVYNIGYSGTHLNWAIPKLEELFGGVYSDVKMVGLVHGINDRTLQPTAKEYSDKFTANLETVVKFLFDKGIQPFMVTTQAVMEPGTNDAANYPLRTSEDINSIANKCKIKIANKYNLEVLDMNTFGDLVLTYSKYDLRTLCRDKIHFGDIGHSLEAGYLFSKVCPRVILVEDTRNDTILSFTSQKIRTDVSSNDIAFCDPFVEGFKSKAQFTKGDTDDWVIQDFWIMNTSKGRYNLNVYTPSVNGVSYVRLDGVTTIISSTEQLVGELEIGLHHVQFLSGKTNSVSCYGFKMKPVD